MKYKKYVALTCIIIGFALISLFLIITIRDNAIKNDVKNFFSQIKSIEKSIIDQIPIYSDYSTYKQEMILRKYLNKDHIQRAMAHGLKKITNHQGLQSAMLDKRIIPIDSNPEKFYYFYNVPDENRYLTPQAYECLLTVTTRFQDVLQKYGITTNIKIALSSAIRIEAYQNKLIKRNKNASFESSHSYGISFDIFYDDFYIVLPEIKSRFLIAHPIGNKIRRQQGFLLAHALRRQLRTVLTETLISLQKEGVLYAILEKKQRCYHVTAY